MLGQIPYIKNSILYQGEERPAKITLMPTKLRAVLACVKSDFAQCYSMLDFQIFFKKPTCGTQFLRDIRFKKSLTSAVLVCVEWSLTLRSVSLHEVRLRTVLACAEFDSAQCQPARSHLFREYLQKNKQIFQPNHFSLFIRGPGGLV